MTAWILFLPNVTTSCIPIPVVTSVSEPYTWPASCRKRWVWELLPVGKLDDVSWEASILGDKRS